MLTREQAGQILDELAGMQADYYERMEKRGYNEEDALQTRAEGIMFLIEATQCRTRCHDA